MTPDQLTIKNTSITDCYRNELFGYKLAYLGEEKVAYVNVNIIDDELHISNIEVAEDHLRRGYATALMQALLEEHPEKAIYLTMMTEDGTAFFKESGIFEFGDDDRIKAITPKLEEEVVFRM